MRTGKKKKSFRKWGRCNFCSSNRRNRQKRLLRWRREKFIEIFYYFWLNVCLCFKWPLTASSRLPTGRHSWWLRNFFNEKFIFSLQFSIFLPFRLFLHRNVLLFWQKLVGKIIRLFIASVIHRIWFTSVYSQTNNMVRSVRSRRDEKKFLIAMIRSSWRCWI